MPNEKEALRQEIENRIKNKLINFPIYISLELLQELIKAHDEWEGKA